MSLYYPGMTEILTDIAGPKDGSDEETCDTISVSET